MLLYIGFFGVLNFKLDAKWEVVEFKMIFPSAVFSSSAEVDGWFSDLFDAMKSRQHKFLSSEVF